MLLAAMTALALSAAQQATLKQALICPEALPDDAARIANTDRFNRLYATISPKTRSGERMEVRRRLLVAKGCDPDRDALQHSFPES